MKIIKEGNEPKHVHTMTCTVCGCEFEVSKDEYFIDMQPTTLTYPPKRYIYANCPSCHKMCKNTFEILGNFEVNTTL